MMLPREHGVYAQLLFPLVTAIAIGVSTPAAFALAAAVVCSFLAHEPLLVLLGQRGARAGRDQRSRARHWFVPIAVVAAMYAALAIALMPPTARVALIIPAAFAFLVVIVIVAGREHTMAGEILTGLTLASVACPLALAAEASLSAAVTCAAVFATIFVSATLAVHAVIVRTRRQSATAIRVGAALFAVTSLAALFWLAQVGWTRVAGFWAALPFAGVALALVVVLPPAQRLKVVGWTLVAASAATSVVLMVGLR